LVVGHDAATGQPTVVAGVPGASELPSSWMTSDAEYALGRPSPPAMAQDQVEVMKALGRDRFVVAGHDRGARVVHRMALDHLGAVRKATVLDILPTLTLYEETDAQFARAYWEWFFSIQGYDLPETHDRSSA
jgi:haloacetate dehalogenase